MGDLGGRKHTYDPKKGSLAVLERIRKPVATKMLMVRSFFIFKRLVSCWLRLLGKHDSLKAGKR